MRASEVLSSRRGYCNTKSTLFIALLRAQGIPARQRFVDIDSSILRGVISTGTAHVDHSYTEVWLDGRWVRTDSYIVDRKAFVAAQARLQAEQATMGYGVHKLGTTDWDGASDAFAQFVWCDRQNISTADYGVHADVAAFYRDVAGTRNRRGLFLRLFGPTAFRRANTVLDDLRRETATP